MKEMKGEGQGEQDPTLRPVELKKCVIVHRCC